MRPVGCASSGSSGGCVVPSEKALSHQAQAALADLGNPSPIVGRSVHSLDDVARGRFSSRIHVSLLIHTIPNDCQCRINRRFCDTSSRLMIRTTSRRVYLVSFGPTKVTMPMAGERAGKQLRTPCWLGRLAIISPSPARY